MEVGDIVVRSYTWPSLVPGIIVEEKEVMEYEPFDRSVSAECYSMEFTYVVMWSDNTVTHETDLEIETYEGMLEKLSAKNKDL